MRRRAVTRWARDPNDLSDHKRSSNCKREGIARMEDISDRSNSSSRSSESVPRAPQRKKSPRILLENKRPLSNPPPPRARYGGSSPQMPQRTKSPLHLLKAMTDSEEVVTDDSAVETKTRSVSSNRKCDLNGPSRGLLVRQSSRVQMVQMKKLAELRRQNFSKTPETSSSMASSRATTGGPSSATSLTSSVRSPAKCASCLPPTATQSSNPGRAEITKVMETLPTFCTPQKSSSVQFARSTRDRISVVRSTSFPILTKRVRKVH